MSQEHDESDQLPEEGPGGQAEDDDGADTSDENAGVPGDDEQSTGNPGAAGSSDPEESG